MDYKAILRDFRDDPIAAEREKQARENYINRLFRPIGEDDELLVDRWLVEGLLPFGYLVLLAGSPKAGKTSFATAIALAVANGVPFAGRPTQQSSVLWIAAEEGIAERQVLLFGHPLATTDTPLWTCYEKLSIDDPETIDILTEWINKTGARFIVVDPLMASIEGRSLNDSWSARRALQPLKQWCAQCNVTAVVLHHPKRDPLRRKVAVADNSQLAATASMSIILSHTPSSIRRSECSPPLSQIPPKGNVTNPAERSEGNKVEKGSESERDDLHVDGNICPPSSFPRRTSLEGRKGRGDGGSVEQKVDLELPNARIVRLSCEGRGGWANRAQLFLSEGPLDYHALETEKREIPKERPLTGLERRIVDALKQGVAATIAQLEEWSGIAEKTIRNVVANLRRKRVVVEAPGSNWPKIYRLAPENAAIA